MNLTLDDGVDSRPQLIYGIGLGDAILCACAYGNFFAFIIRERSDNDNRYIFDDRVFSYRSAQLKSISVRHHQVNDK